MNGFRWCLTLLFLGCTPGFSAAQKTNPGDGLRRFEARYAAARTLQVKFLERYSESGRFVRAEAGVAYFERPGKMRWDYQVPEKNAFLVDGKYVWFYSPADRTVTRIPTQESEDWRTPLAFLTSHMKLSRLCRSIEPVDGAAAAQAGDLVFWCELKSPGESQKKGKGQTDGGAASYRKVLFEVSPEGELRRIVSREQGGMELEFSFTGWEWNPPLAKSTFEFVAPQGVAIVEGLLPETSGFRH